MMTVHDHGPAEGDGLDCPEYTTDEGLVGRCLIEPGAFDKFVGMSVPVKWNGRIIGKAEISENGDVINATIDDTSLLPNVLRTSILFGLADGISIAPSYTPAVPKDIDG